MQNKSAFDPRLCLHVNCLHFRNAFLQALPPPPPGSRRSDSNITWSSFRLEAYTHTHVDMDTFTWLAPLVPGHWLATTLDQLTARRMWGLLQSCVQCVLVAPGVGVRVGHCNGTCPIHIYGCTVHAKMHQILAVRWSPSILRWWKVGARVSNHCIEQFWWFRVGNFICQLILGFCRLRVAVASLSL